MDEINSQENNLALSLSFDLNTYSRFKLKCFINYNSDDLKFIITELYKLNNSEKDLEKNRIFYKE